MTSRTGSLRLTIGPDWAFLPDLRLFLGDPAKGATESIGFLHERIDTWAMFAQDGGEEVGRELFERLHADTQSRRGPRKLPSPTLIEIGERCVESRLHVGAVNNIETPVSAARGVCVPCTHELDSELHGEYRLVHQLHFLGIDTKLIIVQRRVKALKEVYRAKMAELGLEYVPGGGIGSRPKKPVGGRRPLRPAHEHAFNAWVSEMKERFIEERRDEILRDNGTHPADFKTVMASWERSREGEIARKKRDGNGDLKVPHTEFQLLERTATDIARREAAQMMFDFTYEPALVFRSDGRIEIP